MEGRVKVCKLWAGEGKLPGILKKSFKLKIILLIGVLNINSSRLYSLFKRKRNSLKLKLQKGELIRIALFTLK